MANEAIGTDTARSRIKKLSPLLVNQLAAGEVVTRPAAVVKELLENAIDAHATDIEIHITQGGMGMIQVQDNGTGIHPDDMVMAITRHATSKVADVANLHGISTLGFRGEALAAMAAVSRLSLTSSHDDSGIGRQLQVAGVLAEAPQLTPVVHRRGTTVTIKDLYFNVPARRGNLKSIATEFAHIETIVRNVALARADVTLTLFHDNKKRLHLLPQVETYHDASHAGIYNEINSHDLPISRLEQALDLTLADEALAVWVDLMSLLTPSMGTSISQQQLAEPKHASISGWLWPTAQVSKQLPKLLYVNGRLIKEPIISHQLRQLAMSAGIAAMGYALYFKLPSHWLNINVHPSKQRIKISPLNNVLAHLSHVIAATLKNVAISSSQATDFEGHLAAHHAYDTAKPSHNDSSSGAHQSKDSILTKKHQLNSIKQPYHAAQRQPLSENHPATINDTISKSSSVSDKTEANKNAINISDETPNQSQAGRFDQQAMLSTLPYCLDVITEVSASAVSITDDDNLEAQPWVLFFYQGQLLVVALHAWLRSFDTIFAFDNPHHSAARDLDDGYTHNRHNTKQHINQQISENAKQMSPPDLQAFITDMAQILKSCAITHIDSQQLIGLLLSPTP